MDYNFEQQKIKIIKTSGQQNPPINPTKELYIIHGNNVALKRYAMTLPLSIYGQKQDWGAQKRVFPPWQKRCIPA